MISVRDCQDHTRKHLLTYDLDLVSHLNVGLPSAAVPDYGSSPPIVALIPFSGYQFRDSLLLKLGAHVVVSTGSSRTLLQPLNDETNTYSVGHASYQTSHKLGFGL